MRGANFMVADDGALHITCKTTLHVIIHVKNEICYRYEYEYIEIAVVF